MLVPFRAGEEEAAIAAATWRGARAALLYLEHSKQSPELYSAVISEGFVPSVTIRRADALYLANQRSEIELSIVVERTAAVIENIMVEVGAGAPTVLLLANYDTRPRTPGAYRNASGVVALLALLDRLRDWRGHRVLVGFLGAEASAAALGARHCRDVLEATHVLEELRAVVGVSGRGLSHVSGRARSRRTIPMGSEPGGRSSARRGTHGLEGLVDRSERVEVPDDQRERAATVGGVHAARSSRSSRSAFDPGRSQRHRASSPGTLSMRSSRAPDDHLASSPASKRSRDVVICAVVPSPTHPRDRHAAGQNTQRSCRSPPHGAQTPITTPEKEA